ncbi:hypothetical protein apy_07930 [Aeropyrum pernix]|uniref:Uncharacterized protein n=1 Tax=Aeropyrum pernix TaxID=56636 RepID=A0A401H9M9_AERPX|nr:hypothetical protein apy_07930 [Aeropyrum pernix]
MVVSYRDPPFTHTKHETPVHNQETGCSDYAMLSCELLEEPPTQLLIQHTGVYETPPGLGFSPSLLA